MKLEIKNLKEIVFGILVLVIFVLISYILQTNSTFIENNISNGYLGILLYIFITIFATVVAPISAVPLLPIAVFFWGPILAGIFSIIGWTTGSIIAFILARKYGVNLVKRFVSLEKISKYESYIPKKDLFSAIVIMRIFLPVDVLSYILGIFSKVDLKTYSLATFIGVIPFAFILSYIGNLDTKFQILSFLVGSIFFAILFYKIDKRLKKMNKI